MVRARDYYFLLFYFWFRLDLFTKRREDRALKALGAVTVVQVWLVVGSYMWGEILVALPSPPVAVFLGMFVGLFVANYFIMRSGGWEDFERRFALYSARARRGRMAIAAATSLAALAILVSGAAVKRSKAPPESNQVPTSKAPAESVGARPWSPPTESSCRR